MFFKLLHNNRGEADGGGGDGGGGSPAPTPITFESLNAIQGDNFRNLLPEEIRGKGYAKEVNSFGDFVKKFDGAQTLLGQRALPDENATPQQWAEFHSKLRPETADKYGMPETIDGVPAEFLQKASESKVIKQILHDAGASPYQAKVLMSGFLKTIYQADQQETKVKEEEFAKLAQDSFGEEKDTIIAKGKGFLAAILPDNVKSLVGEMDNKSLIVLMAATEALAKKYGKEDDFRGGGEGSGTGGGTDTKESLVAEMQKIMGDPAYGDPFKDRIKHADLLKQMEGLRVRMRKVQNVS